MKKPSPIQAAKKDRRARNGELIEAGDTNRGKGLFARVEFRTGELICGLVGDEEVIRTPLSEELLRARPELNEYGADAPGGGVLVPRDLRALGWHLANHSCNPNARLETEHGVGLRALRLIPSGSEITCWYGWSKRQMACLCGEPNCTGWIGPPWKQGPRGFGHRRDDLALLAQSAWSVRNVEGLKTVAKVLLEGGVAGPQVYAFFKDVLGVVDGEKATNLTGGYDS